MPTKTKVKVPKHEPPTPGTIWLYIDRLDHKDQKVWALHWRTTRKVWYRRFRSEDIIFGPARIQIGPAIGLGFFGCDHAQPKAVVEFHGSVELWTKGRVYVRIE